MTELKGQRVEEGLDLQCLVSNDMIKRLVNVKLSS
jgi:hypothetical protein